MDDAKERFSRSDLLFGENCAAELALKRVLIVGVGGVGGHARVRFCRDGGGR